MRQSTGNMNECSGHANFQKMVWMRIICIPRLKMYRCLPYHFSEIYKPPVKEPIRSYQIQHLKLSLGVEMTWKLYPGFTNTFCGSPNKMSLHPVLDIFSIRCTFSLKEVQPVIVPLPNMLRNFALAGHFVWHD